MRTANALRDAVKAANDFKYWLDIQTPGTVFHPSGADVRATEAYATAAKMLDAAEAALKRTQSSESPRQVLVLAVPVRDVVAEDGTDTPASALDVLAKGAGVSGVKVVNEGANGAEDRSLLDLGGSGHCFAGKLLELLDDEVRIVHCDLRGKRANVQGDRRCAASSRSVQRAKRTGSTAGLGNMAKVLRLSKRRPKLWLRDLVAARRGAP